MAWQGLPGRQLYYEDTGRGDAVVLMPGWGGSIADLGRLRRDLADGFRVVAVDLPGSGRSEPQPRRPATPGNGPATSTGQWPQRTGPIGRALRAGGGVVSGPNVRIIPEASLASFVAKAANTREGAAG